MIYTQSPPVDYFFSFVKDPRFLLQPNKTLIFKLAGPGNTIPHVELAVSELDIRFGLSVSRLIPTTEQFWRIIPETGIACRSVSTNAIELFFDPDNSNTVNSLNRWSGRQIAHELNHIARMSTFPLHNTLLDALISEGLAVYYEEHWQDNFLKSHWGHSLSKEQLRTEWLKAKNELSSENFDFADWFYGRKGGPPYIYRILIGRSNCIGLF